MPIPAAPTSSVSASASEDVLSEMTCVWTTAFEAWSTYLGRLAIAADPVAAFQAGADFWSESLQIGDRATSARLSGAGVASPLLTDA